MDKKYYTKQAENGWKDVIVYTDISKDEWVEDVSLENANVIDTTVYGYGVSRLTRLSDGRKALWFMPYDDFIDKKVYVFDREVSWRINTVTDAVKETMKMEVK
jgi:hypothetical protein